MHDDMPDVYRRFNRFNSRRFKNNHIFRTGIEHIFNCTSKKDLEAYGRRLEDGIGRTAACIFTLYIVTVLISAMVVANIENVSILEAMFECVSAIATVGLTLGITTQVGAATEIILIILMMLGRIGSVTVLLALFSDKGKIISKHAQEKYKLVKEKNNEINFNYWTGQVWLYNG